MNTEYAFVGFSYEITACPSSLSRLYYQTDMTIGQSLQQLDKEFADIKYRFKGRYVRLYGFCDNKGY